MRGRAGCPAWCPVGHRADADRGAAGYDARWNQRASLAASMQLDVARTERLLDRYGDRIDDLVALIGERPELSRPLDGAYDYLAVEVVYACSHEGALRLEDVLERRTRISFEVRDRGVVCAPAVAALMAGVLGWDADRTASELAALERRVAAELRAEQLSDDAAASAAIVPRREQGRPRARSGDVQHALHRARHRPARARARQRARRLLVPGRGPRRAGSRRPRRLGDRGDHGRPRERRRRAR